MEITIRTETHRRLAANAIGGRLPAPSAHNDATDEVTIDIDREVAERLGTFPGTTWDERMTALLDAHEARVRGLLDG